MKDVSIVTINLNNKTVIKTIDSINNQTFSNYEFIVIDGKSPDGSLEVIKNNNDFIYAWVSEKDGGIWDAMNKGILMSSGKFIHILNSGDIYFDKTALQSINFKTDKKFICRSTLKLGKKDWVWLPRINEKSNYVNVAHPGLIVEKQIYINNLYSTDYNYVSDNLFISKNVKPDLTDINDSILVTMEGGGFGSSISLKHEIEKHSLLLFEAHRKEEKVYLHLIYLIAYFKNIIVKLISNLKI